MRVKIAMQFTMFTVQLKQFETQVPTWHHTSDVICTVVALPQTSRWPHASA